jgi:hypothetical protein
MIIPINDKYRISSDKRQWILQIPCAVTKKTPSGWKHEQYYTTLQHLMDNLPERLLRESNAVGIAEGLVEVKRIQHELAVALSPNYTIMEVIL